MQFNNGEHGFDNEVMDMKTIFRAAGPSFKRGLEVEPFESVHVYELMCRLLGIVPEANDGLLSTLLPMLQDTSQGPLSTPLPTLQHTSHRLPRTTDGSGEVPPGSYRWDRPPWGIHAPHPPTGLCKGLLPSLPPASTTRPHPTLTHPRSRSHLEADKLADPSGPGPGRWALLSGGHGGHTSKSREAAQLGGWQEMMSGASRGHLAHQEAGVSNMLPRPHSLDPPYFLRVYPPAKRLAHPGDRTAGGHDSSGQGRIIIHKRSRSEAPVAGGWVGPCSRGLQPDALLQTRAPPFAGRSWSSGPRSPLPAPLL